MRLRHLVASLIALALVAGAVASGSAAAAIPDSAPEEKSPRTEFEASNGEQWTSHKGELSFLKKVDALSERAAIDVIGKSVEGRPLHLVRVGSPRAPKRIDGLRGPTILFVCTQHGNEPAGREACLQVLRDLALYPGQEQEQFLEKASVLFVPTANPDGREANVRENARGVDINRDHLNLVSPEARAIAAVVRDWRPDLVLDLHEYGPSLPVIYDDEVLYLWPRNLNVDKAIHDLSYELANDYIEPGSEEAGFRADEYGKYEVADQDIHQSAGDGDEGILRNAMGLRHALGILIETAVTADPRNGPGEVTSEAAVRRRRVAAHLTVSSIVLEFFSQRGRSIAIEVDRATIRKALEGANQSAPVYFGGADNDEPSEDEIQDPPPCQYQLSPEQFAKVKTTMALLGIGAVQVAGSHSDAPRDVWVPMAQPSEPLIPLLLDERGRRHAVAAEPDYCGRGE